jgi:hypothetical protein
LNPRTLIEACLNSASQSGTGAEPGILNLPGEAVCMEIIQKACPRSATYGTRTAAASSRNTSPAAIRRLDALLSASPAPTRNQTIIVGCPPNEWHTVTPLLLALFLRRRSLNVLYLGANGPVSQFTETVRNGKANLVVLVAQHLLSAATLQHTALVLSSQKIPVAFGGRIFNLRPEISSFISGYFLGNDLNGAREEMETILSSKLRKREPKAISEAYAAAHQAFVSKRAQIELSPAIARAFPFPGRHRDRHQFLGDNIAAALQLGDMSHLLKSIGSRDCSVMALPRSGWHILCQTCSKALTKASMDRVKPILAGWNRDQDSTPKRADVAGT